MKLISLNCEGHKHLERIIPWLKAEQPDVICLQEIFEVDLPTLESELNMTTEYAGMATVTETSIHQSHALGMWGVVQLSKHPRRNSQAHYYVGTPDKMPIFLDNGNPNAMNRVLLAATFNLPDGHDYTIGTTHFTWSENGDSTDLQQKNLVDLMAALEKYPEIVFCGDFNAPRGRRTFQQLAEKYQDNIPPEITTTIDGQFHKAGQLDLMVDGLFSTSEYKITNVQVVDGVSDHKGIIAEINKN